MRKIKKGLALLLALAMMVTLAPTSVFAEEITTEEATEAIEPATEAPETEAAPEDYVLTGSVDGINVVVEAPAEAFPNGAELQLTKVAAGSVEDAVQEAVENASVIAAVDIAFIDNDGAEVEPAAEVNVKITLDDASALNNDVAVVHVPDEGEATTVDAVVDGDTVEYTADEFSVYAIVETPDENKEPTDDYRAYEFYDYFKNQYNFVNKEGETTYIQHVTNGGTLYNPGTPETPVDGTKNLEFLGWGLEDGTIVLDAAGNDIVINNISGNENEAVKLYATYSVNYYLLYHDEYGNIYSTNKVTSNTNVDVTGLDYMPSKANQAFLGWSTEAGQQGEDKVVENVNITGDDGTIDLYPVIANVYWVSFDKNDWVVDEEGNRTGTGALYVSPKYVLQGESYSSRYSELPTTTRPGYDFAGWYTDESLTTSFNTNTVLTGNITVYAKWNPKSTLYTVVIWRQYASDAVDATDDQKTYYYAGSTAKHANTGTEVSLTSSDTSAAGTGFKYNASKSDTDPKVVAADGSTVLNV